VDDSGRSYVLFGIVVVIGLAFGFGLALAPGGRHGGSGGSFRTVLLQWFINVSRPRCLAHTRLVLGAIIITGEYRLKTGDADFSRRNRVEGRVVTAKLGISFGSGVVLAALTW